MEKTSQKLDWNKAVMGYCPKCSTALVETYKLKLLACPTKKCGFAITTKRLAEISQAKTSKLNSKDKKKTRYAGKTFYQGNSEKKT